MSSLGSRWVLSVACVTSSLFAACGGADSGTETAVRESLTVVSALAAQGRSTSGSSESPGNGAGNGGKKTSDSTPPTTACGKQDIGGWTIPVPVKADSTRPLKDLQQSGSRIHYVSPATGDDKTAQFYLWNGTQIVDGSGSPVDSTGRAYGTDPMNPSSAVKAFKRWAAVGPMTTGRTTAEPHELNNALEPTTRKGYPDWWLFKRGDVVDLYKELQSVASERALALDSVYASLGVSGGRSATAIQVVGAYGDLCQPRPRFIHPHFGFVQNYQEVFANVAYLSLHFDAHDRSIANLKFLGGIMMLYQTKESRNLLFEDMWFDAATIMIGENNSAEVTIRRSLITDNYSVSGKHQQGIYYSGSPEGVLRVEEAILLRNGFSNGDPKLVWPPSGQQKWDIYNRNLYISGQTDGSRSGFFDSVSMMGASGDQFRSGGKVERSFFYQGYVTMGATGGYPDATGSTGAIVDNVLQRFVGTGTDDNRGQPGWGLRLTSGANAVEVSRNIVTGAQYAGVGAALTLGPLDWACVTHWFRHATRNNRIHGNIFEAPMNAAAFEVSDGVKEPTAGCSNWQSRGVHSNVAENNVLVTESGKTSQYSPVGAAIGSTDDTGYRGNQVFATRIAAGKILGWQDPNRTLKTYLQSIGVTVSSSDGFMEYYGRAIDQRRGQWRYDLMSKPIINHIRQGYGQSPLP
jgi:hypothetical protein